jgi:Asp-tRNA(Asn)/Glu-tRNA(Gln) amidotransferase A subunit family amidase
VAVSADGGGSIRIPACLTGQYGVKGTFARFSEHGALSLCHSVAHAGPIAATPKDAGQHVLSALSLGNALTVITQRSFTRSLPALTRTTRTRSFSLPCT